MSLSRIPRLTRSLPTFRPLLSIRHAGNTSQPPVPIPEYQPKPTIPEEIAQSPNVTAPWSTSQNPKPQAFDNARFEQTDLSMQPNSLSAMGMVAKDPIRMVNARVASCDGGGGPLGHPKVFINLDKPGPKACGYCGIRFEKEHHAH